MEEMFTLCNVTLLARLLLSADGGRICSRAELVFIREHCFASKSSAAVREAFNIAFPDREVPDENSNTDVTGDFTYSPVIRVVF
jgi:hypothetical protein